MAKAWKYKLGSLQLASRWHHFSYEKQRHLPDDIVFHMKNSAICQQNFVERISILKLIKTLIF